MNRVSGHYAGRNLAAFSPDGTKIVYVANSPLFLRTLTDLDPKVIGGTEAQAGGGAYNPVFSPDSASIAFYCSADTSIKRIPVSGGAVTTLCTATNPFGMTWSDSRILFGQLGTGIMRVPVNGAQPDTGKSER